MLLLTQCLRGPHRNLRLIWGLALGLFLASGTVAEGQTSVLIDALRRGEELVDLEVEVQTEIIVSGDQPIDQGWIELTPLLDLERPPLVVAIPRRSAESAPLRLAPELPNGPAMLCTGAESFAVHCRTAYLYRGPGGDFLGELEIPLEWLQGTAVSGRYVSRDGGLAAARVALVPAALDAQRTFTMPLSASEPTDDTPQTTSTGRVRLVREVTSDAEGYFKLPPVAAGEYFLETLLPNGRLHRSAHFNLPDADTQRLRLAASDAQEVVWDLGDIDVLGGLGVEVRVQSTLGGAIPGARVTARQGHSVHDLKNFQATTNSDGAAWLSGFLAEDSAELSCSAPGFVGYQTTFDLLPTLVLCDLTPMAKLSGDVRTANGETLPEAWVTLQPLADGATQSRQDDRPETAEPPSGAAYPDIFADDLDDDAIDSATGDALSQAVDGEGNFSFVDLPPGPYRLTGTAPGYEIRTQDIVLESGEDRPLGTLRLMAGRAVKLRVVDARNGQPLADVAVRSQDPPGAVDGRTDADGELEFATAGDRGLTLVLEADGYAETHHRLTADDLAQDDPFAGPIQVALERPGWIRVVIYDETANAPCRGCPVILSPLGIELHTDELGHVLSPPLEPRTYRVYRPHVTHLGSTVVEQADAERRYAQVRAGNTSLVRFGESRQDVRISLDPAVPANWGIRAHTDYHSARLTAQSDGSFRVRHRPGEALHLTLLIYDPGVDQMAEVQLATLPADLTARDITLPLNRAAVRGRLTTWDGQPLAGRLVRLASIERHHAAKVWTDAEGRFHIPHAPHGVYGLHIGRRNMRFISISPSQTVDVGTLQLEPGRF